MGAIPRSCVLAVRREDIPPRRTLPRRIFRDIRDRHDVHPLPSLVHQVVVVRRRRSREEECIIIIILVVVVHRR